MTGNGYVSNSEPWWAQESREAMEELSGSDNDEAPKPRRYCKRCDFYTDHVSTAHDGLAERGLLLPGIAIRPGCQCANHEMWPDPDCPKEGGPSDA